MKSNNQYHGVLPEAVKVVRYWAHRLTQHPSFTPFDLEDLEQELMLDLHIRLPRFDPRQSGLATFASMVISRCASRLIEEATTAKSGGNVQRLVSLDTTVISNRQGEQILLQDTIGEADGLWHQQGMAWNEVIERKVDFSRVLFVLPKNLSYLASRLLEESASEVARSARVSQATIHVAVERLCCFAKMLGFVGVPA
ncbi:MAG: hypothetical protein HQM04_09610 [Magnetococcales bacterium]|nr:hypothetical protein [Magnetococcales bacterium]